MGADQSRVLSKWSTEDAAKAVVSLGHQYEQYEAVTREIAVEGKFLLGLEEDTIEGKLEGLGVASRLHRRVLAKKILGLQKQEKQSLSSTRPIQASSAPYCRQESLTPDEKAQLWIRMKAAAEQQKRDNECLMQQEAALRLQVASALGA